MRVCYTVLSITGSYMKHMCKDVIIICINLDFIKKMIMKKTNINQTQLPNIDANMHDKSKQNQSKYRCGNHSLKKKNVFLTCLITSAPSQLLYSSKGAVKGL